MDKIKKISDKEYWDEIYESKLRSSESRRSAPSGFNILIKMLLGKAAIEYIREYFIRSYTDYVLWDVIYKKHMPNTKGLKVLEIGSAPGDTLIRLNERFGFIPYGVDYSQAGIESNKKLFILHGLDPNNVIYADFLSGEFRERYKGHFDVVISNGFIEHFTDAKGIVEKHIDLLAKSGCLIVTIPNLKGAKYTMAKIFYKRRLPFHNTGIMQKSRFLALFDRGHIGCLFCDYCGIFDFDLFAKKSIFSLSRILLGCCDILQLILNVTFRFFFKDGSAKNSFFSQCLVFIGTKL